MIYKLREFFLNILILILDIFDYFKSIILELRNTDFKKSLNDYKNFKNNLLNVDAKIISQKKLKRFNGNLNKFYAIDNDFEFYRQMKMYLKKVPINSSNIFFNNKIIGKGDDQRVLKSNNNKFFICFSELKFKKIVYSVYELTVNKNKNIQIKSFFNQKLIKFGKNFVPIFFRNKKFPDFIIQFDPLIIAITNEKKNTFDFNIMKLANKKIPVQFKDGFTVLRGGSNGIWVKELNCYIGFLHSNYNSRLSNRFSKHEPFLWKINKKNKIDFYKLNLNKSNFRVMDPVYTYKKDDKIYCYIDCYRHYDKGFGPKYSLKIQIEIKILQKLLKL